MPLEGRVETNKLQMNKRFKDDTTRCGLDTPFDERSGLLDHLVRGVFSGIKYLYG
jgi:hypothetical protein